MNISNLEGMIRGRTRDEALRNSLRRVPDDRCNLSK